MMGPGAAWTWLVPLQGTAQPFEKLVVPLWNQCNRGHNCTVESVWQMSVKSNPVNTRGKEEGTGGGSPSTRAGNFLQSVEETTLKLLTLQSREDPTQKQLLRELSCGEPMPELRAGLPGRSCGLWRTHAWSSSWRSCAGQGRSSSREGLVMNWSQPLYSSFPCITRVEEDRERSWEWSGTVELVEKKGTRRGVFNLILIISCFLAISKSNLACPW